MSFVVYTAALVGLKSVLVTVETAVSRGERSVQLIGLPDKSVRESKERVMAALRNTGVVLGSGKKLINLAPANIPKIGPSYDLAIALSLMSACGEIKSENLENSLFFGELALDGSLREVNGILPALVGLQDKGFRRVFVPTGNAREAALIKELEVVAIGSIGDLLKIFKGSKKVSRIPYSFPSGRKFFVKKGDDFSVIRGQMVAKRALEIAAVGRHNILMFGVPGSGKTSLARAFISIVPRLTAAESLEVTKIYSAAGKLPADSCIVLDRPFRMPHHSASRASVIGGSCRPSPGEISLAHKGVLFLDEFPEFSRTVLEDLRQPLEEGMVNISRNTNTYAFPADFQLIAAMNPCPCGYFGDRERECKCNEFIRGRYLQKISGPLLDRIDMVIRISRVRYDQLVDSRKEESSEDIRKRVIAGISFSDKRKRLLGADMNLSIQAEKSIKSGMKIMNLTPRGYNKVLSVARSIADLENRIVVEKKHVLEALSLCGEL